MPRISNLTSLTTPDASDELAIVDTSASVTKKITRSDFLKGAPLPNDTVTTSAITNGAVTASKIDFTTLPNGGKLMVQTKTVSYSGTYDAAGSVFYKDIGTGGNWDVPFTSLISVSTIESSRQVWSSVDGASTTSSGNVRVWRWTSTSLAVTVTVTGIGIVA